MRTVAVSGGFDPIHAGHVQLLEEARKLGDRLVVILNNDNWLHDKKGFVFMEAAERKKMLLALRCVDDVFITSHSPGSKDRSVCRELRMLQPTVFANGGDRGPGNVPEESVCDELGIDLAYNVGGDKTQSSSWLLRKIQMMGVTEKRPWGSFTLYAQSPNFWVKTVKLEAGGRTSLQTHKDRSEVWLCVEGSVDTLANDVSQTLKPGDALTIAPGVVHRLGSATGGVVVEVAYGRPDELDIVRLEDDYNR